MTLFQYIDHFDELIGRAACIVVALLVGYGVRIIQQQRRERRP